ncbi:hypothetical protein LguiA_006847 [Lonicera macranthoides]
MTMSKTTTTLVASLVFALFVLQLVESDQLIVEQHVKRGASYHQGQIYARGHAGLAATGATAYHRVLLVTKRLVPVTLP